MDMDVVQKYLYISDRAGRMPGGAAQNRRRSITLLDSTRIIYYQIKKKQELRSDGAIKCSRWGRVVGERIVIYVDRKERGRLHLSQRGQINEVWRRCDGI